MAQVVITPAKWKFEAETIELIPLLVKIDGVATTNYTIAVVPHGTDPVTFAAPTSYSGGTGYLVNGPTLGKGYFEGYVKIGGSSPEVPVLHVFQLTLT